jgi:hypothetical protein
MPGSSGQTPGHSPNVSGSGAGIAIGNLQQTQKQKLAAKLREVASLALSITTGKKLSMAKLNKQRPSYVIPGFGYALMDVFENDDVDMDSITKRPAIEESKSPFKSPTRLERRLSPKLGKTMSSVKKRKSRRKKNAMMRTNKSVQPFVKKSKPIQYKLIKVKTSVGNYPILNINPPFTNDEIRTAKKCALNKWTAPPGSEEDKNTLHPSRSMNPKGGKGKAFTLEVTPIKEEDNTGQVEEEKKDQPEGEGEEVKKEPEVIEPRTRASGGLWLQAADFPHCFQYFIVYYNYEKFATRVIHKNLWTNPNNTFQPNENEVFIRVRDPTEEEIEEEKEAQENAEEENKIEVTALSKRKKLLYAFSPNPTSKPQSKLPRYYCRLREVPIEVEQPDNHIDTLTPGPPLDVLFSYYFSGRMINLSRADKILLNPQMYAPMGYCLWLASEHKIDVISHSEKCVQEDKMFSKKYEIEQGNIEKDKYSFLFKFDFNPTEPDTECIFK